MASSTPSGRSDERVAAALEAASRQASGRGAPDTAAELADLARELTPADESTERIHRTIHAGQFAFEAGELDKAAACLEEAGDLIQPLRAGIFDASHIYAELGEIVLGRKEGRASADEITYFKSVGIAVQDAVAAQLALDNARRMKLGQEVSF